MSVGISWRAERGRRPARAGALAGLCLALLSGAAAKACEPRDFLSMRLPAARDAVQVALSAAYPDVVVGADGRSVEVGGQVLPLGAPRAVSARQMLAAGTIREQFAYRYPLEFDLAAREAPHVDPGRIRNAAFMEALWFSDPAAARASLRTVRFAGLADAAVQVTTKRGVDCQLAAVVAALQGEAGALGRFFAAPGGGFNWRRISGTDRLSAHSFGIAVDLNPALGGYWKWAGAPAGAVGPYANRMPPVLVQAFERFGFIWGGKWHHYDGMHFEYRPELILHSRLTAGR